MLREMANFAIGFTLSIFNFILTKNFVYYINQARSPWHRLRSGVFSFFSNTAAWCANVCLVSEEPHMRITLIPTICKYNALGMKRWLSINPGNVTNAELPVYEAHRLSPIGQCICHSSKLVCAPSSQSLLLLFR